jgi:cardiolipin synthase
MAHRQKNALELLDAKQYLDDLISRISRAEDRVVLMSPILADDQATHTLIDELTAAAERGVIVSIATDVFTYSELGGYLSPFKHIRNGSRASTAMAKRLIVAGASFVWLGDKYQLNPFKGVTHIKWAIVDTVSYGFGGTNIYQEGIESTDFMFRSHDPQLADEIFRQHHAITNNTSPREHSGHISKNSHGTMYIDSGEPGESIIYDRICELANSAKDMLIVTQYCPSGTFAQQLRQDNAKTYYNQPRNAPRATGLLITLTQLRTGLHSLYSRNAYLHAKFIIFTMPSGERIAITGSHNFAYSGVRLGTREVALETNDPYICEQLQHFYEAYVK